MTGWGHLADDFGGLPAHKGRVLRGECGLHRGLLLDGRHDLRVLVTDVRVDQLAGEVEVLPALEVPQPGTGAALEHEGIQGALGTPGMEHVSPVEGECHGVAGDGIRIGHAVQGTVWTAACPL